jgi:hypothetical protein
MLPTGKLRHGMISASGSNGSVSFDGRIIRIIRRPSLGTFLNQGVQGDRFIIAKSVSAIEFREATARRGGSGFISFDFPGKNPPRGGVFDALADENAVVFDGEAANQAFRDFVRALIEYLSRDIIVPSAPPPERLPVIPTSAPRETAPADDAMPPDHGTERVNPVSVSSSSAWLFRPWTEGQAGWSTLLDAARANGWSASRAVGMMKLERQLEGVTIHAFSVDEAVQKLKAYYAGANELPPVDAPLAKNEAPIPTASVPLTATRDQSLIGKRR